MQRKVEEEFVVKQAEAEALAAYTKAQAVLAQAKVSQQESDEFFDLYDTDGSGAVDIDELVQMVAAFKQRDSSTLNRTKIQEVWDADGDGSVRLLT